MQAELELNPKEKVSASAVQQRRGCSAHLQRGGDIETLIVEEHGVLEGHSGRKQRADVKVGVVEAAVQYGLHDLDGIQLGELLGQLLPVLCLIERACMPRKCLGRSQENMTSSGSALNSISGLTATSLIGKH